MMEIDITTSDFPVLFCRDCYSTYSITFPMPMQEEAVICPNCKREGLTHLTEITLDDFKVKDKERQSCGR